MRREPADSDLTTTLLRLLVGSAVAGSDLARRVLGSAEPPPAAMDGEAEEPPVDEAVVVRARQALVGLLFETYGGTRRGLSAAGEVVSTAGRFWSGLLRPIVRSRAMDPVRLPYELLVERGSEELERWARIGRAEERRSREVVERIAMAPVDDVVAYLREDPEFERLVRRHAESVMRELEDDAALRAVVREQGDRYVDHLREHPESIQELVRGQSVGMAEEVANTVRQRTVRADDVLERFLRAALGRRSRSELPGPPEEVRERASPEPPDD